MRRVAVALACCVVLGLPAIDLAADGQPQRPAEPRPSFRSAVDLVSVIAVVRDRRGRMVTTLSKNDFEILDKGVRRPIIDFRADEQGPVSVALLFDVSGSMQMSTKMASARHAADQVLTWLHAGVDEAALFVFDAQLRAVQGFTTNPSELHRSLDALAPFGATSLFDAVADAAQQVVVRASKRRALVVITDGIDTSSRLRAGEVSGIASSIDVPVYVIVVTTPLEDPASEISLGDDQIDENLRHLANWTGGDLLVASAPAQASVAARQLLQELRHQYLIAFEAAGDAGWHPLEIRTRDKHLSVRARSGYIAGHAHAIAE